MKTVNSRVFGNSFRNTFACVVVLFAFITCQDASARAITINDNAPIVEKSATGFQAAIHPIENSLCMKVRFVDSNQEGITVIIKDSHKALVYKKSMRHGPVFHGSFNLESLPDDVYTIEVKSRRHTYSRSVSIQTQYARIAHAL